MDYADSMARKHPSRQSPKEPEWRAYDPGWLVQIAVRQLPDSLWLHDALRECTWAAERTCCAPKVCGFTFVDASVPNQPGSAWQFETNVILERRDEPDVILDVLQGGRIGGIEFF